MSYYFSIYVYIKTPTKLNWQIWILVLCQSEHQSVANLDTPERPFSANDDDNDDDDFWR